jgi:hypothetical protein
MKRSQLRVTPEELLMRFPHLRKSLAAEPVKQDEVEIPFSMAVTLLRGHVVNRQLKAGKPVAEIYSMMEFVEKLEAATAELIGEVGTIDAVIQRFPVS